MESQRQKKVARLIQKEIGVIFQEDKKGIVQNQLITVMDVRISPDLSVARIYLSLTMVADKGLLFKNITDRKSEIRLMLGRKIGKQVRKIPDLIFYIDEIEENAVE